MTVAVGAVLLYFEETQKRLISNIKKLSIIQDDRFVHLDNFGEKKSRAHTKQFIKSKKGLATMAVR